MIWERNMTILIQSGDYNKHL